MTKLLLLHQKDETKEEKGRRRQIKGEKERESEVILSVAFFFHLTFALLCVGVSLSMAFYAGCLHTPSHNQHESNPHHYHCLISQPEEK